MSSPFDGAAAHYDDAFTNTLVGRAQRDVVWKYLNKHLPNHPLRILELNCGTGEDAIWLADKGHSVVATDASTYMLDIARTKAQHAGAHIYSKQWDLTQPCPFPEERFDVVFSNFGGLNCLAPEALQDLFKQISGLLNPGGRLIMVVMGRFCLWESLYFLSKLQYRNMFRRRRTTHSVANLDNVSRVDTYYYGSGQIKRLMPGTFQKMQLSGIGICIPPTYLNKWMARHTSIFSILVSSDKFFRRFSPMHAIADHYLLDMTYTGTNG